MGDGILFVPCTDLASERLRADLRLDGVSLRKKAIGNIEIERLLIRSEEGAKAIGKPCGTYVTVGFPSVSTASEEDIAMLSEQFLDALNDRLIEKTGKRNVEELSLLIVGLGNRSLSADTVGIRIAESIRATAHVRENDPELFRRLGCASLSVLIPGVLSQSGMEAADRVAALLPLLSPDAVVVFDALAARSYARIGSTVQISDSGIEPGSGIGNRRKPITENTLGIPVIAVGIPTVCDTATLVRDALSLAPEAVLSKELEHFLATEKGSFVSPGDVDTTSEKISSILAESINRTYGIVY